MSVSSYLIGLCFLLTWTGFSHATPFSIGENLVTIGQNFTGSTLFVDSNFIPPDSNGAVGVNHFVEQINGRYSVYSKSDGTPVQTSTLIQFWGDSGVSQQLVGRAVDPRVVYDHSSQRWFASALNEPAVGTRNFLLAVSKSSDPTMGWNGFALGTDVVAIDFPTLGVDADGVYIADRFSGAVVSIPKADLLLSTPTIANLTSFDNDLFGSGAPQPAVDFGPSDGRPYYLKKGFFLAIISLVLTCSMRPALVRQAFLLSLIFRCPFSFNNRMPLNPMDRPTSRIIFQNFKVR